MAGVRYARWEIAQPVTITGFYMAAFLLIGLLGAASKKSFYDPATHALTGAFYYGIWAAVLYMVVASLMLITVWGAMAGKYQKQFSLTTSQRTLMLQTIIFMVYLLIGALVFSTIEGWHYLEAVYWADFTLLTIGIGSPLTPTTHLGRSLLIPFAIGGIITVGLIIGSIRSMLLDQGKEKMRARATEKMRERVHSYADVENHRLGPVPDSKRSVEREDIPQKERRRREFHAMRKIQERAASKNRRTSLFLSMLAACVLWFIGALVFMFTEYKQGWTYFVSLYFSYTSLLTIGYGDLSPLSNSGRAFFVLWSLLAIPTLTVLISDMGDTVVKGIADLTIWVGSLTILPSQPGTSSDWRKNLSRFTVPWNDPIDPSGLEKEAVHTKEGLGKLRTSNHPDVYMDSARTLHTRLGKRDTAHCLTFRDDGSGNAALQDRHFYRWLLAKEVNNILNDKNAPDVKKYDYDEWSYFLKLLGHDEHKPELHRRPNPPPRRSSNDEVQLGHPIDQYGNIRPWSWMGLRSPLMSPKDDVDWLLQNLLAKLQRELEISPAAAEDQLVKPPVSLSMLESSGEGSSGSEDGGSSNRDQSKQV